MRLLRSSVLPHAEQLQILCIPLLPHPTPSSPSSPSILSRYMIVRLHVARPALLVRKVIYATGERGSFVVGVWDAGGGIPLHFSLLPSPPFLSLPPLFPFPPFCQLSFIRRDLTFPFVSQNPHLVHPYVLMDVSLPNEEWDAAQYHPPSPSFSNLSLSHNNSFVSLPLSSPLSPPPLSSSFIYSLLLPRYTYNWTDA